MSRRAWVGGAAVAGVVAAGTAVRVARHRRRPDAAPDGVEGPALGSLRGEVRRVVCDDGVELHVEVDEPVASGGRHRGRKRPAPPTVVFAHGYTLNLDVWHFQRAHYRDAGIRAVYYDQRSHGRSGRSSRDNSTIEQLGQDLRAVIDQVVPEGPVVLVGHSMGGMTIVALAEEHPELFGDRVVGVGLVSTTAGGLNTSRILLPILPENIGAGMPLRVVAGLARTSRFVDGFRSMGRNLTAAVTQQMSFGGPVPPAYTAFVDEVIGGTPFEVLAEFFPSIDGLDKFAVVSAFAQVPTVILCGTADRLTSIGHSRKLHSLLPDSRLVEVEGAGHMVILESHDQVNAALDELLLAAEGAS